MLCANSLHTQIDIEYGRLNPVRLISASIFDFFGLEMEWDIFVRKSRKQLITVQMRTGKSHDNSFFCDNKASIRQIRTSDPVE